MHAFSLELFLPAPTNQLNFKLLKKNTHLVPDSPGVYVFEREEGDYSYSGKADSLRTRFKQHLKNSHNDGLNGDIQQGKIKSFFYFLCDTELDATILERYFIQGGFYCGEHNVQYTKENRIHKNDDLTNDEYEALLQKEKNELQQMMKEDEEIKKELFEKFAHRIRSKLHNIRPNGQKDIQGIYAKELFIFLFGYIRYTKHVSLNWTKFKEELDGKIDAELVRIIDSLCQSKSFRKLLIPRHETGRHYETGRYKFEIRKEAGEEIYYFDYTAPEQYNKKVLSKGCEKHWLTTKDYVKKYIK